MAADATTQEDPSAPPRWLRRLAIAAGVVALAAVIWRVSGIGGESRDDDDRSRQRSGVTVELYEVGRREMTESVRGVGTLDAGSVVDITTEVAGRVDTIHFREGAAVAENELLVSIRDSRLRQRHAAAQASLIAARSRAQRAEADFERARRLRENRQISEGDFDEARANLETTRADAEAFEAELALIAVELEDTRIRAPFSGLISSRAVDRGAYVEVGERIATLYNSDPLEINFSVAERHLDRIDLDMEVEIHVASYPDEQFSGRLDYISPAVDSGSRTIALRALVDNPDGRLRPGAFANVRLILERRDYAVVPAEALIGTRDGYIAYRVEDDTAHEVRVETSLRDNGWVAVSEGVSEGDRIVRRGHSRLNDGDAVRIVDNAASGAGAR